MFSIILHLSDVWVVGRDANALSGVLRQHLVEEGLLDPQGAAGRHHSHRPRWEWQPISLTVLLLSGADSGGGAPCDPHKAQSFYNFTLYERNGFAHLKSSCICPCKLLSSAAERIFVYIGIIHRFLFIKIYFSSFLWHNFILFLWFVKFSILFFDWLKHF